MVKGKGQQTAAAAKGIADLPSLATLDARAFFKYIKGLPINCKIIGKKNM